MAAPFDLNLRHLRAVAAIVERGSLSAAAEAVSLSQPALTQGLAKLERQIDAALFDRRSDGLVATAEGHAVAARAARAMAYLGQYGRSGRRGFGRPEQLVTATQARAFLALADAGSFVGASAATGLSQPAIHRAARDLEQVIGVALVERRGRGVALTAGGRRLARGIRLAGQEIAAAIAEVRGVVSGRLVVGAMPLSRARLLPAAIARLLREAPATAIDVVEGSWSELVEPLRDGILDLMIGALRGPCPPDLDQRPLFVDRLAVVARADHPLIAGAGESGDGSLDRFPWIIGRAGTPLRLHWEALFAGRPLPVAPIECGSVMTIRGLLVAGDYLTLLSPDQVRLELDSKVLATVGAPLTDATRVIGVTTRLGWRPTGAQARFVDALAEIAKLQEKQ